MTDSGRYQLLFRFFCELTSGSISDKLLQSVSIALLAYQTKPRGSHRKDLNESDIIPNPVGRKTFSREITYILYNHQSRVISPESPKRCALCKYLFTPTIFFIQFIKRMPALFLLQHHGSTLSLSPNCLCYRSLRTIFQKYQILYMHRYRIVISKKDFSILKIGDDTLWRNYFLQLLLRSIVPPKAIHQRCTARVNLQKKLSPKSVSFPICGI